MAAPRGAGQWHKISRTFIQDGSEMHKQLPDLYAALRRAQELPPTGRTPYIAGRRCGWATPRPTRCKAPTMSKRTTTACGSARA